MHPPANMLLDIDLVRTFVAISDSGSFTSAATQVLRTPSAISMQMKRLEGQLGRSLFTRDGRSVALTTDGEALLGYARQLLRVNEEAVSRFLVPPVEGRVRFGAPDDFGTRFLPNILSRFAATHPKVEVSVVLTTSVKLQDQLKRGKIDLTLVTTDEGADGAAPGRTIYAEPLIWVGVKGGRARDTDPLPLALSDHGCVWRAAALRSLDLAERDYRIAYTCENCQGQLAALLADLAIAPLPLSLLTPDYERLDKTIGLKDIGHYQIRLCEQPDAGPASKAFAAHVAASFAEIAPAV
ncbi:MAG: LysR substrate-binding domain-containing protein, partial [Geminicoccaceae bacterium]